MKLISVYLSDSFRRQIWPCFEQEFEGERAHTLKNYKNTLEVFCEYVRKDFLKVTKEDVLRYYEWIEGRAQAGGLSKRTMLTYKKNLRAIACATERYIDQYRMPISYENCFRNSVEGDVRTISEDAWLAKEEDVEKLVSMAHDAKERLILLLLSESGLTPAQICGLKWEDIIRMDGEPYLLYGGRQHGVRMSRQMDDTYREYRQDCKRSGREGEELFRNRNGNLLNFKGISSLIRRCRAEAGIKEEITARQLRDHALVQKWKRLETDERMDASAVRQSFQEDEMQFIRMRELALQFPEQFQTE